MKNIFTILLLTSGLGAQTPYDLVLKGGHVVDPKNRINGLMDVAIADGKIARVAADIPATQAKKTVDVGGLTVAPGLIDIHVHVYPRPELKELERDSNVQADAHTFRSGVTTVVDAGTSGWKNFPDFKARVIEREEAGLCRVIPRKVVPFPARTERGFERCVDIDWPSLRQFERPPNLSKPF